MKKSVIVLFQQVYRQPIKTLYKIFVTFMMEILSQRDLYMIVLTYVEISMERSTSTLRT